MSTLSKGGRYRARLAETRADVEAAQALRYRCFVDPEAGGLDADTFDAICAHVLVEDRSTGDLVCCFRLMPLDSGGAAIGDSYSAQFYHLDALGGFAGRMVEMGRFCIAPDRRDPDILRVAWGGR